VGRGLRWLEKGRHDPVARNPQPKPNLAAISTCTGELVRSSALSARPDPWRSWSRVPSCEFRGRNQQAALMRDPFPGGLVIAMLLLGRRVETPNGVGQRRRASLASAVCSSSFSVHASGPGAPPRNGVQSSSRRPLVPHILFRGHTPRCGRQDDTRRETPRP
jgi:hypothetical protein